MKLSNTLLFSSLFFLFFLPKSSTISFFYSFHHVTSLSYSSSAISSFLKGSAVFSSTSSFTSLRGRFIRGISLISLSLSTLSSQSPSVSNNHDNEAQESVHLRLAQTQPFSSFFPSPKKYPVLEISEYRNLSSNETLIAMTGRNQTKLDLFAIHLYGRNFSKFPLEVVYRERNISRENPSEAEYFQLWKESKFLTQGKTYEDDWNAQNLSIDSLKKPTVSIEVALQSHLDKLQIIEPNLSDYVEKLRLFLFQNVISIANQPMDFYSFHSERSFEENLLILKQFLIWFRQVFPYYHEGCLHCLNHEGNSFLGQVYSNRHERDFDSFRTELYFCKECHQVLEVRRGRCGEYSILMMGFLKALNYSSRYVLDRDDHSWTEILLSHRWIHLDPCEASINEPLIYQGWGKNQTFIIAIEEKSKSFLDVTPTYTLDLEGITRRRNNEGVDPVYFNSLLQNFTLVYQEATQKATIKPTGQL